jgi:hypothetical protein
MWKPEYNRKRLEARRVEAVKEYTAKLKRFNKMIDPALVGYTAGIIDGEGCILINKQGVMYTLQIRVGMATTGAVRLLHKLWGGSLKVCKHKDHTPMNVWVLSSIEAEGLLKRILPKLIVKADEARVALAFREHIRSTKRLGRGGKMPIDIVAKREAYRIKLQEMKRCVS